METIKQAVATALVIALALLFFIEADAKVIPNPIFADNMVLQQNAQVAFWGEAEAGAKVKITPSWSRKSKAALGVPDGTQCEVRLHDGKVERLEAGIHKVTLYGNN